MIVKYNCILEVIIWSMWDKFCFTQSSTKMTAYGARKTRLWCILFPCLSSTSKRTYQKLEIQRSHFLVEVNLQSPQLCVILLRHTSHYVSVPQRYPGFYYPPGCFLHTHPQPVRKGNSVAGDPRRLFLLYWTAGYGMGLFNPTKLEPRQIGLTGSPTIQTKMSGNRMVPLSPEWLGLI